MKNNKYKYEFIVWFSGLGISSCSYYGGVGEMCGFSDVPVSITPEACTSLVYDGAVVDLRYHIGDPCSNDNFSNIIYYYYIITNM